MGCFGFLMRATPVHEKRGPKVARGWYAAFVLLFAVSYPVSSAEPPPENPADLIRSEILITSGNVTQFRTLAPPSIVALVQSGDLEMRAVPTLHFEWKYDDEWIKNSLDGIASQLGEDGAPELAEGLKRGFVFGPAGGWSDDSNGKSRAAKIIWNTQSLWWGAGRVSSKVNLGWQKDKRFWTISGHLNRVYLDGRKHPSQLFRELLTFREPKSIAGLGFLTFRFLGTGEDAVWLASPAIRKVRQLTGVTRGEPLVRSSLSLDDLMLWSAKPEEFQATLTATKKMLVPAVSTEMAAATERPESGCIQIGATQSSESAHVSAGEGHAEMNEVRFVPSSSIFVVRDVLVLEIRSNDPFARSGRQMVYVDAQSMLPVYREVFSAAGRPWKVLVSGAGLAVSSSGKRKFPYPGFTAGFDQMTNQPSRIIYNDVTFCETPASQEMLQEFDPRKLGYTEEPQQDKSRATRAKPTPVAPVDEEPIDER